MVEDEGVGRVVPIVHVSNGVSAASSGHCPGTLVVSVVALCGYFPQVRVITGLALFHLIPPGISVAWLVPGSAGRPAGQCSHSSLTDAGSQS